MIVITQRSLMKLKNSFFFMLIATINREVDAAFFLKTFTCTNVHDICDFQSSYIITLQHHLIFPLFSRNSSPA